MGNHVDGIAKENSMIASVSERVASSFIRTAGIRTAGTWSSPRSKSDVVLLVSLIKKLQSGELGTVDNPVTSPVYNLIGDDDLFDKLDSQWKYFLKDAAEQMVKKLKEWSKMKPEDWKTPETPALCAEILKKVGAS